MTAPDYDEQPELPDDESQDEHTVNLNRQQIRSLERDAKRARKADEETTALKRELAFVKAGINPDTDPKLQYFMDGYKGEATADAIRQAADTAGFLTPTTSADTDEAAAHQRVAAASAGATSQAGKEDPIARLQEAAAKGKDALLDLIRKDGHNII